MTARRAVRVDDFHNPQGRAPLSAVSAPSRGGRPLPPPLAPALVFRPRVDVPPGASSGRLRLVLVEVLQAERFVLWTADPSGRGELRCPSVVP